jgi:DNA-binding GntR family transcriptional regulator
VKRTPSERDDLITLTYERLRQLITSGRLAPGSRVVEREIAERLGISRTPVRSALHRLRQEGYVLASERGKHTRLSIAPLTREDARELFDTVGAVEGLSAAGAAELPPLERTKLVRELRRLNEELREESLEDRPDQRRLFDLDMSFHRRYVETGAGPRLRNLHEALKPQAERYVRLYISALVGEIGTSVAEHEQIIRAIDEGEAATARASVETNWRNASDRLAEVILQVGERGSWG